MPGSKASSEGRRLIRAHAQKLNQPQQEASLHTNRLKPHTFGQQTVSVLPHAQVAGRQTGPDTFAPTRGGHDFSRLPVHAKAPVGLQAKLTVNTPGDSYEQEADRVSAQVTGTSEPQHACACGGGCASCQSKQAAHTHLQAKHVESNPAQEFDAPPVVQDQLHSAGQPLPTTAREFMEPRFGHDFSRVRVHTDGAAANAARAVRARAYTIGQDIVFGSGEFTPATTAGQQLLAHELTHVVQQNAGGAPTQAQGGMIQRFESDEHQRLGNVATTAAHYDLGDKSIKSDKSNKDSKEDIFELTHGDILALSGDVFLPDDLFRLAAIPGDHGKLVGTRDEILWALQDPNIWELRSPTSKSPFHGKKDPRFEKGGLYGDYKFSDAVKTAVLERYQKLGAINATHFVSPGKSADPTVAAPVGAGGNYRKEHETAITDADKAGRAKASVGPAMAREAAAQHYLTDAFSAGHLRTPIFAIRDYWSKKYPLFFYNLLHKIAFDTGLEMTKGTPFTTNTGYTQILGSMNEIAAKLPSVTLGDLLGSVFHDYDNEHGLNLEGGGKVMGDKHLDQKTEDLAVAAIKTSNKDVNAAYDIGKQTPTPLSPANLYAKVRQQSGVTGDKYAAEAQMPETAKSELPQNWKAPDIRTLWYQPFLLGRPKPTVGDELSARIKGEGSIAVQLKSLASKFPECAAACALHPRKSYLDGFVKQMQDRPENGVFDVVYWTPHDLGSDTGTAARDMLVNLTHKRGPDDKGENLSGLDLEQRIDLIIKVMSISKGTLTPLDQVMIVNTFQTAKPADRVKLYERIEEHDWTGDFKSGKNADKLAKALNAERLAKVKDLINAGTKP